MSETDELHKTDGWVRQISYIGQTDEWNKGENTEKLNKVHHSPWFCAPQQAASYTVWQELELELPTCM